MCAAMSPKERNISKPVAASMAFAIFCQENRLVIVILSEPQAKFQPIMLADANQTFFLEIPMT